MKKLLLTIGFSLLLFASAQAQLKWGIKGGVSTSNLDIELDQSAINNLENISTGSLSGFHVGVAAQVKIPIIGIYVQPELLYSQIGGEVAITSTTDTFNGLMDVSTHRLDIPVLIGWRVGLGPLGIRPMLGPVGSITLNNGLDDLTSKINDIADDNSNLEAEAKAMTWGYQAGVGLDIWKLSADLKYEGSFSGMSKDLINSAAGSEVNFDSRATQWILSLGFWF